MRYYVFLIIGCFSVATSCSKFAKVQKSKDYEYKLRMAEKYYAEEEI